MYKFLLAIMFLLISTLSYAQVRVDVEDVTLYNNMIMVWSKFYYDGDPLQGETEYDKIYLDVYKLVGKSENKIIEYIQSRYQEMAEHIIMYKYRKAAQNPVFDAIKEKNEEILSTLDKEKLKTLSFTFDKVDVLVDSDMDKQYDKKVTIKSDLTKTEKNLAIPIPMPSN